MVAFARTIRTFNCSIINDNIIHYIGITTSEQLTVVQLCLSAQ